MAATVDPVDPGQLGSDQVRSGSPVRGIQWGSVARACNHLNGGPRAIIPHAAALVELAGTTPRPISYRVFPSHQATHRLWLVSLAPPAEDEAIGTRFRFTDPSGGVTIATPSGTAGTFAPTRFHHVERVASRTSAETTLTPIFESLAGTHVLVSNACFELPRPELALDALDLGVELGSFGPGGPVFDSVGASLGALPEAIAGALARARRTFFQWGRPDAFPASTSSGTFARIVGPQDPTCLERRLYAGEDWVACPWRLRAWCSPGTTGEVRLTSSTGDVSTIAVSATSATWHSGSLDVMVEDLSTADGWPIAHPVYTVAIEARRTSGAGSLFVSGLSIHGRAS